MKKEILGLFGIMAIPMVANLHNIDKVTEISSDVINALSGKTQETATLLEKNEEQKPTINLPRYEDLSQ